MKKLLTILISAMVLLFLVNSAYSMTLAWNTYTDPIATDLRIYSSSDGSTWSILVDNIPTNNVASDVPDGTKDYTRVYYMMRAYDSVNDNESKDSNTISFYWTVGGDGHTGPAGVGGIRLIDCDQVLLDNTNPDYDLCTNRHVLP